MSQIEKAAAETWRANRAQKVREKKKKPNGNNDNNEYTQKLQRRQQQEPCNLKNFEFPYHHQNGNSLHTNEYIENVHSVCILKEQRFYPW